MPKGFKRAIGTALAGLLVWAAPAQAQFSDGYEFLDAVKKKNGQEVTDMLAGPGGTLINSRDISTGESALHIVVNRRDRTWLEFLIARGANQSLRDAGGHTALGLASTDAVKRVLTPPPPCVHPASVATNASACLPAARLIARADSASHSLDWRVSRPEAGEGRCCC